MNSRDRLLTALDGGIPDRLPLTTHHLMPSFLDRYLGGISNEEFFERFGLDAVCWIHPIRADDETGEYYEPGLHPLNPTGWIANDHWRICGEDESGSKYQAIRYRFTTPKGELTMLTERNEHTEWVTEHLIKEKKDIDLLAEFATAPKCDVEAVNKAAQAFGDRGIVRGHICCFDIYGQPGVWQDAACLYGIERLIMETFDDPDWVHEFLGILLRRKMTYVTSLKGAAYDLLELGGGDASSTVISPDIFNDKDAKSVPAFKSGLRGWGGVI